MYETDLPMVSYKFVHVKNILQEILSVKELPVWRHIELL